MRRIHFHSLLFTFTCACLYSSATAHGADLQVLTQHNDGQRTGANLSETVLSPTAISTRGLSRLGGYAVTGKVFAQPLFVTRNGHHMLYIATSANLVYAFDADQPGSGPLFPPTNLGSDKVVPSADVYPFADNGDPPDIEGGLGIISTPVIDLQTSTLYCVAMTKFPVAEKDRHHGNPYVWTLYALDLDTLRPKAQVEIWHPDFDPHKQLQRAALALANNRIYTAWASFGDRTVGNAPWDGWVLAYGAIGSSAPLRKLEGFLVARSTNGGGIWHSGGGPAIDPAGNLYVVTGNGARSGHEVGTDYDSSDVKLTPNLIVSDYYTPSFWRDLNKSDLDLAVSGPMIPAEWLNSDGKPVRRVLHGSKQGILYNVNRDGMGHLLSPSNQDPVQMIRVFQNPDPGDQDKALHIHTTPVFWESNADRRIFVASDWGLGVKAYRMNNNGRLDAAPIASSPAQGFAVTQMSLSANGRQDGVLWMIGCVDCIDELHSGPAAWHDKVGALMAFDAMSLRLLSVAPIGKYPRFTAPTVANGCVYVPTFSGEIAVYGLAGRNVQSAGRKNFVQSNWGRQGNFELLVPQGKIVNHYIRDNDNSQMPWHLIRQLPYRTPGPNQLSPMPRSVTLIQSNYKGDGVHGNFEAVVRVSPALASDGDSLDFWFLNSRGDGWQGPFPISAEGQPLHGVTGDPVLIQGTWGSHGNLELLVPQGRLINHYFRDNDDPRSTWHLVRRLSYPIPGRNQLGNTPRALTFIQSNYQGDGVHGNLEAIARVAPPVATHGDYLDFWFLDSKAGGWQGPFPLTVDGKPIDGVTGDPVLIQGSWGRQGNFELLVPQGRFINHYFRNNDDSRMAWHLIRQLPYRPPGPNHLGPMPRSVAFFQSNYRGDVTHGNLEAIVRVAPPIATQGDYLDFWFLDSKGGSWQGPFALTADGKPVQGVTGF